MNNPVPILVTSVRSQEGMDVGSVPVILYADDLGEQGPQGIQGIPGQRGSDGAMGPQGPRGVQGPQGVQGPKGERGSDGTSIVIDGYVDTVEDLPDLTGQPPGSSYIVMANGHIHFWNGTGFTDGGNVTGPAGADGSEGPQGPPGVDGAVGATGPRGDQGEPGPPGEQGIQGPKGDAGEGVPVGGSEGQVLVKRSSADYDTEWVSDQVQPGEVGFSYFKSGSVVPDDTSQTLDFGSYRLRVRLWSSNLRVAYLELTSTTGSSVLTDHSMIGYASSVTSGEPGVSGNTGSRVTISSGSWKVISGRAEHSTFVIHDRTTNQTWEGVCSAPWNGTQPVGYVLRVTRIS